MPHRAVEIQQCNNLLECLNKHINMHKNEKKKVVEDKDKLTSKVLTLTTKVQELQKVKKTDTKATEEAITQLKIEKTILKVDLDIALAQSDE